MPLPVDKYLKLSPRHRRRTASPETGGEAELDPANVLDHLPDEGVVDDDPTSADLDPYRRELAALQRGQGKKKPPGP